MDRDTMVGDNIGRGEATAFRRVHSIDHVDSKEHRPIIQPLLYIYIYRAVAIEFEIAETFQCFRNVMS